MENLKTRNAKIESLEELVQFVENHKRAGLALIGVGAITYVLDKNLKDFLHNLNNTIAENGLMLDSKLGKVTIPPRTACNY